MPLTASAVFIDILIVIDTEYVKKVYGPNQNGQLNPQPIDHNSEFMICTGSRGPVTGQGSADMGFQANPGDQVSFRGVSVYDNSDDAIIVYGIQKLSGDNVFNTFVADLVTRAQAVMPDTTTLNGLPALLTSLNFTSYGAQVKAHGVEAFVVQFALYTLADDGETQQLYGYYQWDPTITVH